MPVASSTDLMIHFATNVFDSLGLPGTFVLMRAETGIPSPAIRGRERAA